jgi:hypothetical protein
MEGKQKLLAPFDQFVLSTWVVKTCLTLDASHEPREISGDVGSRRFFTLGYPIPVSEVTIGYDPDHQPEGALLHSRMKVEKDHLLAVFFCFQFESLVFGACINIVDDVPSEEETVQGMGLTPKEPYHERIWPPQGYRFLWPSDAASVRRHPERAPESASRADVPVEEIQGPPKEPPVPL